MITERLMKPGSFSVRLREDYPFSVASEVDLLDHIVITPTRLDPISGFSGDANILDAAIYTGVITRKASPRIFEGSGLAWWLGTDAGIGDVVDVTAEATSALSTWVTAILAFGNGITAGSVSDTGLSSVTAAPSWCSPREALDLICRVAGAEWRVNPDGTLDAAKSPNLFVSTPTVVVTRKEEGQDGAYRGLEGSLIVTATDAEQYTTEVYVVGQGNGSTVVTEIASGSTSYKTFANTTPVLRRLVNAPTEPTANAAAIASAQVALWNQVRRELSLSSRTYNVTRHIRPGDYVWAFDQLAELTDAANQITYRGELIAPIKLRVHALTWPVEQGMGVYARRSGATPTYTDLSDFVAWETGDVVWDVGTAARAANDVDAATSGSTAYLGANPAVAARASSSGGAWQSYTPTVANFTKGNGSIVGSYCVDANNMCDFEVAVALGSTSSVTGAMTVTLPLASLGGGPPPIGSVEFYIGGIGAGYMHFNGGAPTIFTPSYISSPGRRPDRLRCRRARGVGHRERVLVVVVATGSPDRTEARMVKVLAALALGIIVGLLVAP